MAELTPELESRLLAIMDYVGEAAKGAGAFAAEQAPLVAQELIRIGIWGNAVVAAGMFIAAILVYRLIVRFAWERHRARTAESKQSVMDIYIGEWLFLVVVAAAAVVGLTIGGFIYASQSLRPAFAPRVYLIEWCRDQIKH